MSKSVIWSRFNCFDMGDSPGFSAPLRRRRELPLIRRKETEPRKGTDSWSGMRLAMGHFGQGKRARELLQGQSCMAFQV